MSSSDLHRRAEAGPQRPPVLALCLPRAALDAQLALALQAGGLGAAPGAAGAPGTRPRSGWLAHGTLVLQPGWGQHRLLVAALQAGAPRRLPLQPAWTPSPPADAVDPPAPRALALVYLAQPDEPPPPELPASGAQALVPGGEDDGEDGGAVHAPTHSAASSAAQQAWTVWVARAAPDYRLACTARMPDLALLWLRSDGLVRLGYRPGDAWAAWVASQPQDGARRGARADAALAARRGWLAVPQLQLPGAELLVLDLLAPAPPRGLLPASAPASPASQNLAARAQRAETERPGLASPPGSASNIGAVSDGRFSRQAGALGAQLLRRLQDSRIALVGAGRIGSALAHSLARMGCSLLVIEPDTMSPHSLDGDLAPWHEGRPKVEALTHQLRGLLRPGATLDMRMLPIASPAVGALLADTTLVLCCVDNDAARLWANAWALALLKPLLTIATEVLPAGAEAELRLLPPATGCLACCGGFAQAARLPAQLALPGPVPTPADFRQQRTGSLRSWNLMAAHAGLRLLEHLAAGRVRGALFRRLLETADGGLQVQDWQPLATRRDNCPLCRRLGGAGLAAVRPGLVAALAGEALAAAGPAVAPGRVWR